MFAYNEKNCRSYDASAFQKMEPLLFEKEMESYKYVITFHKYHR